MGWVKCKALNRLVLWNLLQQMKVKTNYIINFFGRIIFVLIPNKTPTNPSTLKKWKVPFWKSSESIQPSSGCTMYDLQSVSRSIGAQLQEEMEVEGLDGATASLIFFVVVAILVFGCLQVGCRWSRGCPGLEGERGTVVWVWYVIHGDFQCLNCEFHRIHVWCICVHLP